MSNSFITKINRFAPTAPGSGLTKSPTYLEDPDPGKYHEYPKWDEQRYLEYTLDKYNS
jgi:hypothetical protein